MARAASGPAATKLDSAIIAPSLEHKNTIIWMHGLGDSSDGFYSVFGSMLKLPNTRVVLPNAPVRSITCNSGYRMPGWYDIVSLTDRGGNEDEAGIAGSAADLTALIAEEAALVGSSTAVSIGGFSQGGAMAVYTGLAYPEALGSIISFSAYLLSTGKYPGRIAEANKTTPLFISNGGADAIVPLVWAREGWTILRGLGLPIRFTTEAPQAHEVTPTQLEDLQAWIVASQAAQLALTKDGASKL
eukprot:c2044_g1_i1.p1 GENE.c2044_g1_i1~~c2044_g1_i1.p1  ORF type:complete len:285 (+),score=35.85 c2044_g1_i1:125-856(+)